MHRQPLHFFAEGRGTLTVDGAPKARTRATNPLTATPLLQKLERRVRERPNVYARDLLKARYQRRAQQLNSQRSLTREPLRFGSVARHI